MGIEDRDYTRASSYSGALAGWGVEYISPVVKWLIIVNVAVFVAQIFLARPITSGEIAQQWRELSPQMQAEYRRQDRWLEEGIAGDEAAFAMKPDAAAEGAKIEAAAPADAPPAQSFVEQFAAERVCIVHEWLELKPSLVLRGQVWRLVTYAFCHDRTGLFHILINMLFLYWFGVTLESMYGGREFLLFYLAAALVSGIAVAALDLYVGSNVPAVGASGAVMGVLMLYAIHYPRSTICLFWFWPVEVRFIVIFYALFDLYPVLLALAGDELYTGIAHAGHLGGLAFGLAYWKFDWNLEKSFSRLPTFRLRGPKLRVVGNRPPRRCDDDVLEAQLDEVLRKLHESGEESLTDLERIVLERASERYKRRGIGPNS